MAPSRPQLRVEPLEDRTVPTATGSPWPSPGNLTLSFAADGTRVGDATSALSATLGNLPPAAWQREVLRAFQTWAVQTNANVGLVADGGAAFGTPGEAQGDFRFGDVRVGARLLSDDSLANASPFDWAVGTGSGDVVLNTRSTFAINPSSAAAGADLFTVMLHEAGHVFGLEHTNDRASALYEQYTGRKTGLTAGDVALVRSYYGARQPDAYEGRYGNQTNGTATPVDAISGATRLRADVRDVNDVDTYSLLNTSLLGTLAVRVKTSGFSLLTPKVSVYDGWGRLLTSATAAGPGKDVEVNIPRTLLNLGYYVKVTGATDDVFGVGGYEMSVVRKDGLGQLLTPLLMDGGLVDSLLDAVSLEQRAYTGTGDRYELNAALEKRTDVDFYSVTAPHTADATPRAMVVTVRNTSGRAHADLAVFDAAGRPVAAQVLHDDGQVQTIQVLGIRRGETYFVRASSPADGTDATGGYHLTVDFQEPAVMNYRRLAAGQLAPQSPTAGGTLTVNAARLYEFAVTSSADQSASTPLTLTVRDAAGRAVFTLSRPAGGLMNGSVYLSPGTYTVELAAAGAAAPVGYWLGLRSVSDPVGPYETDESSEYPTDGGETGYQDPGYSGGSSQDSSGYNVEPQPYYQTTSADSAWGGGSWGGGSYYSF